MRRRYIVSAGIALVMVAGGAVAWADPFGAGQGNTSSPVAQQESVTLPTGDVVSMMPGGGVSFSAADDRKNMGHLNLTALDDSNDVIVVPADKVDGLASGEDDPRRYNVSALLRNGQTDAAEADLAALGDQEYGQFAPVPPESLQAGGDAAQVDLIVTDHNGDADDSPLGLYVNLDTGDTGEFDLGDDGTLTAQLDPGDYDVVTSLISEDGPSVGAITEVTVEDEAQEITVDGAEAELVETGVEGVDADRYFNATALESGLGEDSVSIESVQEEGGDTYVKPIGAGEDQQRTSIYRSSFGTGESVDPAYHLSFRDDEGIPAEPLFSSSEDELAAIDTQYQSLGSKQPANIATCGVYEDEYSGECREIEVDLPTAGTQYYTPGDDIVWANNVFVQSAESDDFVGVMQQPTTFEPGPAENSLGNAPLGTNLTAGGIHRFEDTLTVQTSHLNSPTGAEMVSTPAATGSVTVSRDDEELDKVDEPVAELELPEGDSGRYTVTVEAALESDVTPLATKGTSQWEFESEPSEEGEAVDLSAVVFDAVGVENGLAPVGESQEFSLDYLPQGGAAEVAVEEMTFKVSYDDGDNWEDVDIERDGNTASGALEHPEDAEFVSYRVAASDDAGNKFTTSAIRSYGLE